MHLTRKAIILARNKIRKVDKSPSFKLTGSGQYSIIKNGKKVVLNLTSTIYQERETYIEFKHEGRSVGMFAASKSTNNQWKIYHRRLNPDLRGYNIGRVGFRLLEQQIKKLNGKKIMVETNQSDVIRTLLKIGYVFEKDYRKKICTYLKLPQKAKNIEIINLLNKNTTELPYESVLIHEIKN